MFADDSAIFADTDAETTDILSDITPITQGIWLEDKCRQDEDTSGGRITGQSFTLRESRLS